MSRIISRKPAGQQLRVIIDLDPGDTLIVVKASDVPLLRGQGERPVHYQQIITQPPREGNG